MFKVQQVTMSKEEWYEEKEKRVSILRSDSMVRISSTEVKFFPMGITSDLEWVGA